MAQPQPSGQNAVQASSPPSKRDLRTWWKNFKIPSKHQETQGTSALSARPRRSASLFVEHFGRQSRGDPGPQCDWSLSREKRVARALDVHHYRVPRASVEAEPPLSTEKSFPATPAREIFPNPRLSVRLLHTTQVHQASLNTKSNIRRTETTGYLRRASATEYYLRQRCDITDRREREELYLRIRPDRGGEMRRLLEGEGYVKPSRSRRTFWRLRRPAIGEHIVV
jgi:hypothetical protein